MVDQCYRDIYSNLLLLPNKFNFLFQKFIVWPLFKSKTAPLDLHLGSGQQYLEGFLNIDTNIFGRKDMWLDIRNGFPFLENSVDSVYAHMLFEHLYPAELIFILKESYRVLKKGGGLRICVPNLAAAINGYMAGDLSWVSGFPRSFESLGGKFYNFIFCDGQHRMCFDFNLLKELLTLAGFQDIVKTDFNVSRIYPEGKIKEWNLNDINLYVECFKR